MRLSEELAPIGILLIAIVELSESSFEVWKDGKFDGFKDAMEYADDIPEIRAVLKNRKSITAALPLLKEAENRTKAIQFTKEEFSIEDKDAEKLIETIIEEGEKMFTSGSKIFGCVSQLIQKRHELD